MLIRLPVVVPAMTMTPSLLTRPSLGLVNDSVSVIGGPAVGVADAPGEGEGSGTLIVTVSAFDWRPVTGSVARMVKSFWPRARLTACVHAPSSCAVTS